MVEKGDNGEALANPIWWAYDQKWTFGGDAADPTLLETCSIALPEGYGQAIYSCQQSNDHRMQFINAGPNASRQFGILKYKWVPNGAGEVQTDWATNGWAIDDGYFKGGDASGGLVTDGNYLYSAVGNLYNNDAAESDLRYWDIDDGTMLKKIDLKDYWCKGGSWYDRGQYTHVNSGPNGVSERNGLILLASGNSDTFEVLNPIAGLDDETELIQSINGNGDCVGDATVPGILEVCGPQDVYCYSWEADSNLFGVFPTFDMGAVSFALVAPDGTGVGFLAYAGETASIKYVDFFCDNGSAFDGLYTDNQTGTDPGGIWFIGQDSFKGSLSYQIGVADQAPAAFTVAQNTPNPFNPTTTINYTLAKAGHVTIDVFNMAGQKVDTIVNANMNAGSHSVTWNASKFSAGVYFYTVKSGDYSKTMKMTMLK
jgi:hypothetical protein